jgi:hypothetical protein
MSRPQPRFRSMRTLARQPAPQGIHASTFDSEVAAAICRRVAAGESLRSICRADPAMPTEKTVWNWARAHPRFKAMKDHAFATARARSLAARDEAELQRWIGFGGPRGRTGRPSGFSWRLADVILERLVMGEALSAICRDPGAPRVGTVYNWLKRQPEFLASYRAVKRGLEDTMAEWACEALVQPERERDFAPLIRRTVKAAERAARRVSLKRYAPAEGPLRLVARLEEADGATRVLYDVRRP